jgi:hypothetical protein
MSGVGPFLRSVGSRNMVRIYSVLGAPHLFIRLSYPRAITPFGIGHFSAFYMDWMKAVAYAQDMIGAPVFLADSHLSVSPYRPEYRVFRTR